MKAKGNITLALVSIILMAFIGISLLTFSINHAKISRARAKKIAAAEKIYQDLIYYLHHFREKIFAEQLVDTIQPELDYFNGIHFPDQVTAGTVLTNSFYCIEKPKQGFKLIRVMDTIAARASRHPYALQAGVGIDILCGSVPLTAVPLFIAKETDQPLEAFLEEKGIINKDGKQVVAADIETEFDTSRFLLDALKIEGSSLTWATIREKFGLPVSDQPIPQGIYIVFEAETVQTIFVQGDIERLIFSVSDSRQKISIIQQGAAYDISYQPGKNDFRCWNPQIGTGSLFMENVVVNGSAWAIEQEGSAAFLASANITLLVSGRTVITSDLETQGFSLKKISLTNLTLVSSPKGLPNQDSKEAEIVIDAGDEARIQASLLSDGKVENRSTDVTLSGSLFARDLENQGTLSIAHADSRSASASYFTARDFKYIAHFFISYIEEVYDEY